MDLNIDYAQLSKLSNDYKYFNDLPKDDTIKTNNNKPSINYDKFINTDFKQLEQYGEKNIKK